MNEDGRKGKTVNRRASPAEYEEWLARKAKFESKVLLVDGVEHRTS